MREKVTKCARAKERIAERPRESERARVSEAITIASSVLVTIKHSLHATIATSGAPIATGSRGYLRERERKSEKQGDSACFLITPLYHCDAPPK